MQIKPAAIPSSRRRYVRRGRGQMTRSDRGQGDFENGLFTRRFAESDCALMQSHNLTANAQTQSGATCSPASGVVGVHQL